MSSRASRYSESRYSLYSIANSASASPPPLSPSVTSDDLNPTALFISGIDEPPDAGPLHLLTAVTDLASQRYAALAAQRREAQAAAAAAAAADKAARNAEDRAALRRQQEEDVWRRAAPLREMQRLARAREVRRERAKSVLHMSSREIWIRTEELVEAEMLRHGLEQGCGESGAAYRARLRALDEQLWELAALDFVRHGGGDMPLRYVEGVPINLRMACPPLLTMLVPPRRRVDPAATCLQCQVKELRCSRTVVIGKGKKAHLEKPCTRCVRNGEVCCVKEGGNPKLPLTCWRAVEMDHRGTEKEVVRELLLKLRDKERRDRMVLGKWHENDDMDNRKDPWFRRKEWWHVLKDRETIRDLARGSISVC